MTAGRLAGRTGSSFALHTVFANFFREAAKFGHVMIHHQMLSKSPVSPDYQTDNIRYRLTDVGMRWC